MKDENSPTKISDYQQSPKAQKSEMKEEPPKKEEKEEKNVEIIKHEEEPVEKQEAIEIIDQK